MVYIFITYINYIISAYNIIYWEKKIIQFIIISSNIFFTKINSVKGDNNVTIDFYPIYNFSQKSIM